MSRALALCILAALCPATALAQTGTISGTVTRAADATSVVGATVHLCSSSQECTLVQTNAQGQYTFTVEAGTYYLYTQNGQGLIDEVYDDIQCRGYCTASIAVDSGTPVVVTAGAAVTNRNFALSPGGLISGTAVRAATSAPLPGVFISVYAILSNGVAHLAATAFTNASGVYFASGLPTGTYYVYTFNSAGLADEIYDNVTCPGQCVNSALAAVGTPIPVIAGETTANRDFALDVGGTIGGLVVDSATSAPLTNVLISIAVPLPGGGTKTVGYDVTDGTGAFAATGLPAGSYYAFTSNNQGYVDEVFDNVHCTGACIATRGLPIAMTAGGVIERNFALERGAVISGTVTDEATAGPVSAVQVFAYARTTRGEAILAGSAQTNAAGRYAIGKLPTGNYYLYTSNAKGFIDEVFDDRPCLGSCSGAKALAAGTAFSVTLGATVAGRDFALQTGGRLSGTMRNPASQPIPDAFVYAYTRNSAGAVVLAGSAETNAAGAYVIAGLPAGEYYAATAAPLHQDQIYDGIRCLGACSGATATTAGEPVDVALGATTTGIDFVLESRGAIAGTVRNATTSTGLGGMSVYAYRNIGQGVLYFAGHAFTAASGAYTIGGLPAGEYFVFTENDAPFENHVYPSDRCARTCSLDVAATQGTPVPVTAGAVATDINFSLAPVTGRITGVITAGGSAPAPDVYVFLYARAGAGYTYVAYGYTGATGAYTIDYLAPGTYYALTNSYGEYVDEIYGGIPCLTACDYGTGAVNEGTAIVVGSGAATVNFELQPRAAEPPGQPYDLSARIANGTVVFTWAAPYDPPTASDYFLDVGFSPGSTAVSIPVATTTYTAGGVPPGRYFARVRARNAAGVGRASSEYEFTVNADGTGAPDAPFDLVVFADGDTLHFSWSGATSGGIVTGYVLEAGTESGASNLASLPVGPRSVFTYQPLPPPGVYFIRVRARNTSSTSQPSREVQLVIGGAPSPPDPPTEIGFSVDASRRVVIGWMPPRDAVTGYRLEVGTAIGRSDIGVFPIAGSATTMTAFGVAPGTYYVRMRSVNAQGVGAASTDTTVTVP